MKKSAKKTPKAPRAKKPARARLVQMYSSLGKKIDDLSPQSASIVTAIEAGGGKMSRPDLLKALKSALTTDQSASRVLSYYKKPLIASKHIKVEKVGAEQEAAPVSASVPAVAATHAPVAAPHPAPVVVVEVIAPAPAAAPSAPPVLAAAT